MTDTQPLRAVPGTAEPVDHERVERAVREILFAIGEDPDRDGLVRTPARVAEMYAEIFAGLSQDPASHLVVTFEAPVGELENRAVIIFGLVAIPRDGSAGPPRV